MATMERGEGNGQLATGLEHCYAQRPLCKSHLSHKWSFTHENGDSAICECAMMGCGATPPCLGLSPLGPLEGSLLPWPPLLRAELQTAAAIPDSHRASGNDQGSPRAQGVVLNIPNHKNPDGKPQAVYGQTDGDLFTWIYH